MNLRKNFRAVPKRRRGIVAHPENDPRRRHLRGNSATRHAGRAQSVLRQCALGPDALRFRRFLSPHAAEPRPPGSGACASLSRQNLFLLPAACRIVSGRDRGRFGKPLPGIRAAETVLHRTLEGEKRGDSMKDTIVQGLDAGLRKSGAHDRGFPAALRGHADDHPGRACWWPSC